MAGVQVGLLLALIVVSIPLVALAKRANVSYPIVLVLGGLVLGFVPGLPSVQLRPDLVLLLFLPPLLYWESITAPTDVMLQNAGHIGLLAIGLVIATTVAVACVAHAIVPALPWGAAFVLGAIVAPTDELAAAPVLEHFHLPRYVIVIAEGESLLNDATALVIFAAAVGAVVTGTFDAGRTLAQFAATLAGSVAIGYLAGRLGVEFWRRIKDPELQGVISVIMPFLAYIPAEHYGLSGVLAVVSAGVYVNRFTPRVMVPSARTQIAGFWTTLVFVVNAVLFLVVGLQLHGIAREAFARDSWQLVLGYSAAVNVTLIAVRLLLVVAAEYAPTTAPADHAAPDWKHAFVVAWSGLRGSVSLAAALAIPLALPGGAPFPHRDLLIFITFSVILVTLVGGGLSLPAVVRRLGITGGSEERDEIHRALVRSLQAAIERITSLEADRRIDAAHADALRRAYEHRLDVARSSGDAGGAEDLAREAEVERALITAQRDAIIDMRERGEIDNAVMRKLLSDLDMKASRPSIRASAG